MTTSELLDKTIHLVELNDSLGICLNCGVVAYNVEPDAEYYECEICETRMVFGAEEALLRLV